MQLSLQLQLKDNATFDSFHPADNLQLYDTIIAMAQGHGEQFLYFFGPKEAGKTHLLHACCHITPESKQTSMYINCERKHFKSDELLLGLENISLICIDNIEHIAGNLTYEESLFHLFNKVKNNSKRLIISSAIAPKQLSIKLADLHSRLCSGISFQLQPLNNEQKLITALQLRAKCRGLSLDIAVAKFLMRRCCPKKMSELFAVLERLDLASLAEQRRLTIPFIKKILEI